MILELIDNNDAKVIAVADKITHLTLPEYPSEGTVIHFVGGAKRAVSMPIDKVTEKLILSLPT